MRALSTYMQTLIEKHEGKYHRIADEIGVNVNHVYKYIKTGKLPRRRDLRGRLTGKVREPTPPWLKEIRRKIRKAVKETKESLP